MSASTPSSRPSGASPWLATAMLVLAVLAAAAGSAHAEATRPALRLQVIAQEASVHTGPGPTYRSTLGYWYRVELDDGTTGWIYGAFVVPVEEPAEPPPGFFGRMWGGIKGALLGPPAVMGADVEVSFSAGVLGTEGLYLLRPAWLIDEYFALEGFFGLNARAQQDVFIGGLGWTLRMMPGATLGPYVHAGVGAAYVRPKVDNFADPQELLMAISAGGGFELTLKKQITLRLDFRNWTLFDPNQSSNAQEYTSGLAIFF